MQVLSQPGDNTVHGQHLHYAVPNGVAAVYTARAHPLRYILPQHDTNSDRFRRPLVYSVHRGLLARLGTTLPAHRHYRAVRDDFHATFRPVLWVAYSTPLLKD